MLLSISLLTISHVINFSMPCHIIFDESDCGDDMCEIISQIMYRGLRDLF